MLTMILRVIVECVINPRVPHIERVGVSATGGISSLEVVVSATGSGHRLSLRKRRVQPIPVVLSHMLTWTQWLGINRRHVWIANPHLWWKCGLEGSLSWCLELATSV